MAVVGDRYRAIHVPVRGGAMRVGVWESEAGTDAPTVVAVHGITSSHVAWAELALTMLVVMAAVDLSWALLAVRARRLLRSRRAVKVANRASATMMAGAAVVMATR